MTFQPNLFLGFTFAVCACAAARMYRQRDVHLRLVFGVSAEMSICASTGHSVHVFLGRTQTHQVFLVRVWSYTREFWRVSLSKRKWEGGRKGGRKGGRGEHHNVLASKNKRFSSVLAAQSFFSGQLRSGAVVLMQGRDSCV